ncbi:hypothetical protein TcasGA2_TC032809 [Tribolium castaneum]|uniref:Uncharacterized protein n=1 Tax=Tribolium castaneum TaxID=7070 RepID=A0A139WJ46_TRICA|nr:hypothetical protein TcasGA2_TC032809 [Tribolium castaneum]
MDRAFAHKHPPLRMTHNIADLQQRVMRGIVRTKRCKTSRKWSSGTHRAAAAAAKYDCSGNGTRGEMMHAGTAIFK